MTWKPHVTVACMLEHENKLLFVEEFSGGKVVLNQPAGHVEKGESLIQATARETLEESACQIQVDSLLGLYSNFFHEKDITYYRVCFICSLQTIFEDQELDTDIIRRVWLSPEEALEQSHRFRSPLVHRCIEDYMLGKSYPLDLITELPV